MYVPGILLFHVFMIACLQLFVCQFSGIILAKCVLFLIILVTIKIEKNFWFIFLS